MGFISPNITELKRKYLLAYKEEWLSLNGLKVGDEIEISFPYEQLHTNYGGKGQSKYSFSKTCRGILKEDLDGFLYAESIDKLPFYDQKDNGLSGRSYRSWYVETKRNSIIKFGTGFIL